MSCEKSRLFFSGNKPSKLNSILPFSLLLKMKIRSSFELSHATAMRTVSRPLFLQEAKSGIAPTQA